MRSSTALNVLLDSSVWIALYVETDPHHARATRFFKTVSGTIYLPYVVVSEVATVVTYKHSKAQTERFFEFIERDVDIVWLDTDAQADVKHFRSLANKISFADATLLRLARTLPAKLITFDRQLERLARRSKQL